MSLRVRLSLAARGYDVLAPNFPTVRIPIIGYAYNERGGHSTSRTLSRNFAPMTV